MGYAHWILVLLMTVAGFAGGLANHLSGTGTENGEPSSSRIFATNMLISLVAAFTTPLFLSLAKSSLVADLLKTAGPGQLFSADIFIFFGFCLVAAFSARVFVQNLTNVVLNLKREQKALRSEVEVIESDVTDLNAEIQSAPDASAGTDETPAPSSKRFVASTGLEPQEHYMLMALVSRPFTWRSVAGVRKELGLSRETAALVLEGLVARQLVDSKPSRSSGNSLYRITAAGRAALGLSPLTGSETSGPDDKG